MGAIAHAVTNRSVQISNDEGPRDPSAAFAKPDFRLYEPAGEERRGGPRKELKFGYRL